jgi:hypothetical protein
MPLFLIFIIFNTLYNHTFIHPSPFAEACLLGVPTAEPRIELGPALQQADALPTETTPHPAEPRCTLLSHAAPYWATPHPAEPRRTLLSHAAPCWATPNHTEPRRTLLSHAEPYCSLSA